MSEAPTDAELRPLEPQQQKFIQEYLIDFNGTQAAIRAGYAKRSAVSQASHLLKRPHIQYQMRLLTNQASDRYAVTKENVIRELAKIAFANSRDYMTTNADGDPIAKKFSELNEEMTAAISEVTFETYKERGEDGVTVKRIKMKHHDKKGALELLGKHLGVLKDQVEMSGPGGAAIPIQTVERRIVRKPE